MIINDITYFDDEMSNSKTFLVVIPIILSS